METQLKTIISPAFPWRLLSFAAIIFGAAVFIYLGMAFGYTPYLDKQVKNLDQKISALNKSIDENQQKQLIGFYSQLINIQDLLKSRKSVLPAFDLIEKNTYQSANYSSMKMNVGGGEIILDASVPDYETLIKEIGLWNKAPEIKKAVVENISLQESPLVKGKTEIKFSLKLTLQ